LVAVRQELVIRRYSTVLAASDAALLSARSARHEARGQVGRRHERRQPAGFPDTIMFGDPAALAAAAPGLSYLLVAKPTVTTSPRQ